MDKKELLRRLPKIDDVMRQESLVMLAEDKGDLIVTDAVREVIAAKRAEILDLIEDMAEHYDIRSLEIGKVAEAAELRVTENEKLRLFPLINATGTILHTNLGRAPLCREAMDNVKCVSESYSSLEYNVKQGVRGSRHDLVSELIKELTGAEDAMVVNNNAAATMIVLATLGKGREIIVSRGELVEIGGSFRIPDIMAESGAYLREVGTSNKTKASDYENAIITEEEAKSFDCEGLKSGAPRYQTAAIMKVHKSNYEIVGFTEETGIEELVDIGKKHDIPVIYDMGNGLMLDMSEYGLREPNVPASLNAGVDVMMFSGDKLLGGPQAGIIVGKKEYIRAMKKHPLARALRVDKMTFAALEATLMKYRDPKLALRDIPVLRMIAESKDSLRARAERLAYAISEANSDIACEITEVEDQIGGGAAPMVRLPGWAVSVSEAGKSADRMERKLRKADVPVIGRINEDRMLLCVRTIAEDEIDLVAEVFRQF
ncbi:MAG: L-seryl-tRNA(Sec) selenium transferase [Mogibacterium sp.]|nr:L-seryl-tRNA(Sec) selenium transferase [Mogibacterium sp.]